MVRDERLREVQLLHNMGTGLFAIAQEEENAQPVLVRERSG